MPETDSDVWKSLYQDSTEPLLLGMHEKRPGAVANSTYYLVAVHFCGVKPAFIRLSRDGAWSRGGPLSGVTRAAAEELSITSI